METKSASKARDYMIKRYRIVVTGKVHGVSFRWYTAKAAHQKKLLGFVENQADGSVMIEAQGEEKELNELFAWCHQGPSQARVDSCAFEEIPIKDGEQRFYISSARSSV